MIGEDQVCIYEAIVVFPWFNSWVYIVFRKRSVDKVKGLWKHVDISEFLSNDILEGGKLEIHNHIDSICKHL